MAAYALTEEWRDVPGFRGCYQVSSLGRVRSLLCGQPRIRKPYLHNTSGSMRYRRITISVPGSRAKLGRYVHEWVASAFHGPRPPEAEVRHLDGDSLNNCADNLAWGSRAENMADAVAHGTIYNSRKTHCPARHAYTPDNTAYDYHRPGTPARRCISCLRDQRRLKPWHLASRRLP